MFLEDEEKGCCDSHDEVAGCGCDSEEGCSDETGNEGMCAGCDCGDEGPNE